ncbi:MAG: SOS response-associated peptidase [Pseudomonadales bacterium]
MCGRFNVTDSPALQALLAGLNISLAPEAPRYNIAPTENVYTIYQEGESATALAMRWWLTPRWVKEPSQKYAMFNARAETVASSRAFAQPFKTQRAVVPAGSFIEWQRSNGGKRAQLISSESGLLLFAAIWEYWQRDEQEIYSCALLTCDAVPAFAHIHNRQPVMLEPAELQQWLDPASDSDQLQQLMLPSLPEPLLVQPVSSQINNARYKGEPVVEGEPESIA